jgi:hypothetical protein
MLEMQENIIDADPLQAKNSWTEKKPVGEHYCALIHKTNGQLSLLRYRMCPECAMSEIDCR